MLGTGFPQEHPELQTLSYSRDGLQHRWRRELSRVVPTQAGEHAAGFVDHVFALHDTEEIRQLLEKAGFAAAIASVVLISAG